MVAAAKTVGSLASGARTLSKRLVASYIIDWILILGIAGLGGGFNQIHGSKHAFSLQDPAISFPYHKDTVSVAVLIVVSLVAPGVITAIICLFFIPGPTANRNTSKALIWRRKIWEWNTAWMGLGLALASAFMITEGLKDLSGKPRPHLLAVCDPDLSSDAIARYQVGGLGTSLDSAVPIVVDWHICRQTDMDRLRNAFASWPSGHSSLSWAGLLYLSFFICAKFGVQIPFLPLNSQKQRFVSTFGDDISNGSHHYAQQPSSEHNTSQKFSRSSSLGGTSFERALPPRNEAAAPPVYLLIIAFIPIGTAFFISVSRYFDYRHHGFDIISGSVLGIFTAWFGFRWYHLPIRTGSGWAWGARSRDRAFWLGVGRSNYVGNEGWQSAKSARIPGDVEMGHHVGGPGMPDRQEATEQRVRNEGEAISSGHQH